MNQYTPQQNTIESYDCVKVITSVLVVLAHTTRMYTGEGVIIPSVPSPFLHLLTDVIYSFHMPLFTAVSGAVYCYCRIKKHKYTNPKAFIAGKAKRLLVPYFAFGILCVAPVMVCYHFTDEDFIPYVFHGILLSLNNRHLWYLVMLFAVTLFFRLSHRYIENIRFSLLYCFSYYP